MATLTNLPESNCKNLTVEGIEEESGEEEGHYKPCFLDPQFSAPFRIAWHKVPGLQRSQRHFQNLDSSQPRPLGRSCPSPRWSSSPSTPPFSGSPGTSSTRCGQPARAPRAWISRQRCTDSRDLGCFGSSKTSVCTGALQTTASSSSTFLWTFVIPMITWQGGGWRWERREGSPWCRWGPVRLYHRQHHHSHRHFEMYIAFNTRRGAKCPSLKFIRVRYFYFEFQFFVLIVLFMAGFRNATVSSIATILLNQFLWSRS